jgi:hypothetical protein
MADKQKRMAAVLAAVNLYLEQEAAALQEQQLVAIPEPRDIIYNPWGQSGRQEMMAMRKLIQLRTFTRFA